ncbi:MAG: hypothetical protein ACYDH5_12015 [Acidimicrobiales bacterium]
MSGAVTAVLLQQHVPAGLRGRVFTMLGALEETPRLVILPMAGLLAGTVGPRPVYMLMALPIMAGGAIAWAAKDRLDGPPEPAGA